MVDMYCSVKLGMFNVYSRFKMLIVSRDHDLQHTFYKKLKRSFFEQGRTPYLWLSNPNVRRDSGYSYDWYQPLSAEARAELQVWIDYAVAWSRTSNSGSGVEE